MALVEQYENPEIAAERARFMTRVYSWMAFGLFTTSYTAYVVSVSQPLQAMILGNQIVFWGLLLFQLGLVIALSALLQKISAIMAIVLFFIYALANGLTFSVIFLAYTQQSIASAFGITAGMFVGLSAFGYFTKKDLSALGAFLFSALIGLLLAMIVNMFMHNNLLDLFISGAAVLIFSGLIAYDTQKIKSFSTAGEGPDTMSKMAIFGALKLYLDFINLFLHILRLMGRRR